MSRDNMSSVAVVHGDGTMMAVWHVAAEPIVQTARLCGAWVTNGIGMQRQIVSARKVVLLADESSATVQELLSVAQGVVDCQATLAAIKQCTDDLDRVHRNTPTPKGSARAPISWPPRSPVPDRHALTQVPAGVVENPMIRSTIAMARWLASLADTWSAIETIRASRRHLSDDNSLLLPLPFVLTND